MRESTSSFYEQAVRRCVERIVADLDAAVDLHELAATAATSPFHFHRIFRGMVGETPLGLSRRLRLERAAHRLRTTTAPVTTIAFESGYESHEAFTRAFRDAFGLAPQAFRQGGVERTRLAASCGVHFDPNASTGATVNAFTPMSGGSPMDVDLVERPERRVATVLHVGPYDRIGAAFEQLAALAGPAGLFAGAEMVAIYDDDPESTPAAELRSHAGLTVADDASIPTGLDVLTMPAGTYARTLHLGPYDALADAWSRFLGVWLPSSGLRLGDGAAYEVYRNTPMDSAPDDLVTELLVHVSR